MTMEPDLQNTLLWLAVAIILLLIVQTILLWTFVVTFRRWYKRTEILLDEVTRNVEPVLRATRDLLTESKDRLQVLSTNLIEIAQLTKNQITRVDGLLT